VRQVTGKPIKFLGMGEKVDALEPFHPDRLASRILGMGDVMSLIEQVERTVDKEKAEKLIQKVTKGQKFDLNDLREQLQQMKNMGGLTSMLDKLPGLGNVAQIAQSANMTKQFTQMDVIIGSMTPWERKNPDDLSGSRKRRITEGSGTSIQDLNRLLKQHKQMAKMMGKMKGGGMAKMMRGIGGMMPGGGMLPPGMK
jgi:signal recognition particle subunit SRP54